MEGFIAWAKEHTMLLGILVVGGIVAFTFLKKQAPAATTTTTTPAANLSGLQTDANGNPIVYRDVADTFVNVTKTVSDSYNTPASTATTTTPAPAPTPVEHPIEPTPNIGAVRAKFSSPTVTSYDNTNPGGVPVRANPGSVTELRKQPFGSAITITGAPVTGPSNLGPNGSMLWYPVSGGGYISAFDVTSVSPTQ